MPRTDLDQRVGPDGSIIEEVVTVRPAPVIAPSELIAARNTLRSFVAKFWDGSAPTGTPTNPEIRNCLLALIVGERWLFNELDDEPES